MAEVVIQLSDEIKRMIEAGVIRVSLTGGIGGGGAGGRPETFGPVGEVEVAAVWPWDVRVTLDGTSFYMDAATAKRLEDGLARAREAKQRTHPVSVPAPPALAPHEVDVLLAFLDDYAEVLANRGCNDWSWPPGWTADQRAAFAVSRSEAGAGPGWSVPMDFEVLDVLVRKLRAARGGA